jgi:hypothetical protein
MVDRTQANAAARSARDRTAAVRFPDSSAKGAFLRTQGRGFVVQCANRRAGAADRWRRYSVEQGASVSGQDVQPNRTRESRRGTL